VVHPWYGERGGAYIGAWIVSLIVVATGVLIRLLLDRMGIGLAFEMF
jgi:hypothetical protein